MTGAENKIEFEIIETVDGNWWEINPDNFYSREVQCRQQHQIPAGKECVEIAYCWPEGGGTRRQGSHYCVEHAGERIKDIRKIEAGRF